LGIGARVWITFPLEIIDLQTVTTLGVQQTGSFGTIAQGPQTAFGATWWYVDFDTGPDGWVAGDYLTSG